MDLKVADIMMFKTAILMACICASDMAASANDDWHLDGINIAFKKKASQLPETYCDADQSHKCYPADLAVDGNTDGDFEHDSCSHTVGNSSTEASWTVDLGKPFNVTGIVIYTRDDSKERFKNFQIYGDDATLIHNSSGTDEYNKPILTFQLDGMRTFSSITILLPKQHGYSDGGNYYLTLCEVRIYAVARPACDGQENVTNGQMEIYNNSGRIIDHECTVGTIIEVNCEKGLHIDGPPRVQCLSTGEYDYPVPQCVDACLPIPKPSNGHVLPDQLLYRVNDSLKIICDVGYETLKTDTIYCINVGKWENPIPTCQLVYCLLPSKPEHGYYSLNGHTQIENVSISKLPYLTEVIGLCDTGYVSNHFQKRMCNSNKTWSNTETICTPVQCYHPPNVSNVVYKLQNGSQIETEMTFDYNTVLKVTCKLGFTLIGLENRTCESDQTWSGTDPQCMNVTCDFPGKFHNGHYLIRDYNATEKKTLKPYNKGTLDFNEVIEAVCKKGFLLKSPNNTRQCTSKGLWDGENPVCIPVECKWPLRLENGYYQASNSPTSHGMPYNTTLTAICNKTYKLSDNYKKMRCNGNASWDSSPAICDPMCLLPAVENGQFINVISTQFPLGTTLHFSCDPGFTTGTTNDAITCIENHQWSTSPVCREPLCILPNVTNGKFSNESSVHFSPGASIHLTCDSGYRASSDTIMCKGHHQWNVTPVCQAQSKTRYKTVLYAGVSSAVVMVLIITAGICYYKFIRQRNAGSKDVLLQSTNMSDEA